MQNYNLNVTEVLHPTLKKTFSRNFQFHGLDPSAVHRDQWLIERSTGAIYIQVRTLIITPLKQSNAGCKTLEFRDKKWIIIEHVNHLSD